MAQIARIGADKATDTTRNATDNIAELRKRTADQASDSARKAAERTEAMAQTVQRTAGALGEAQSQVAEGTTKLTRGFVDLANEQTRHNLATLKALTGTIDWDRVAKAVDWDQVFQIQGEYLRASLERATQLTRRYFEVVQAATSAAADAAKRQAKKAA
jgi:phasin protein